MLYDISFMFLLITIAIALLTIVLGFVVTYLNNKLKEAKVLGHESYYCFDNEKKLFKVLEKVAALSVTEKEAVFNQLFARPCVITKVIDGRKAWFTAAAPFIPESENSLHPQYVDELLKGLTR